MTEEIKVSSCNEQMKIKVGTKYFSNKVNIDQNLTKYYSDLAKKWAISNDLVNQEDYSSKYYAQKAKLEIEAATTEIRQEIAENLSLSNEQVVLAQEQVKLANQAATKAENIANSLEGGFSDISLSNINQSGVSVIRTLANDMCTNIYSGMILPLLCTENYLPEGFLVCDGREYSQSSYPDFYNEILLQGNVSICSYTEYEQELSVQGKCEKFALDIELAKFRVPTLSYEKILVNDGMTVKYVVFLDEKIEKLETLFVAFDSALGVTLNSSMQLKLNRDHSNDSKPYLKTTYVSGNSWYRIWSDNWCEQGGIIQGNDQNTVITFLKPYKSLPIINAHVYGYYNQVLLAGQALFEFITPRAINLNNFNISTSVYGTCWEARGYIA